MPRKKESKKESFIRDSHKNIIWLVVFFILTVFSLLSWFGKAGPVGNYFYIFFYSVFGVGYFIVPLVGFYCTLLVSPLRHKLHTKTKDFVFSLLLITVTLGISELLLPDLGGYAGKALSYPLIALFDTTVTLLILVGAFLVILPFVIDFGFMGSYWTSIKDKIEERRIQKLQDKELATLAEPLEEYDSEEEEALDHLEDDNNNKVTVVGVKHDDKKTQKYEKDKIKAIDMSFKTSGRAYIPPPLSLLSRDSGKPDVGDIKANTNLIKRTLSNFSIDVEMDEVSIGPSVTRYSLKPAEGVKLQKIIGLQSNLEYALAAHPIRIEAPIPGKSLVGIEVPNHAKTTVGLSNLLSHDNYQKAERPLMIALGKGISGHAHFTSLAKAPHLLIAGATGSGKSVTAHVLVNSLLFKYGPEQLKLILVDPKRVELTLYNGIPHLLTPVITEPKRAIIALKWAVKEMERRYEILEGHRVRDIGSYHKNIYEPSLTGEESVEPMPYIVILIDELADLMQTYPRELEAEIIRLAQMSRAVGIHMVLSTQRPSKNVITGLIKANVPSRIALQVASNMESRIILDHSGAENLLGAGDMLILTSEMSKPARVQSAYIPEKEVKSIVDYLKKQFRDEIPVTVDLDAVAKGTPSPSGGFSSDLDDEVEDELFEDAREAVLQAGKASTSYLQRKLKVGYSRAARLMDMLEDQGIIGPQDGAKPREVLIGQDQESE